MLAPISGTCIIHHVSCKSGTKLLRIVAKSAEPTSWLRVFKVGCII